MYRSGTSLVVQWLRLCISTVGGNGFDPLVGELRTHMPHSMIKKTNKKQKWIEPISRKSVKT